MKYVNAVAYIIRHIDKFSPYLAARISVELLFRPINSSRGKKERSFWETGKPIKFTSGCRGRVFGYEGGQCVWVLHGWRSRGSKLKKLITACVACGCEVVAWDGPAHGDSPGRRSSLAPYTKILVEDIKSSKKQPDAILGHSFGGAASAYACQLGIDPKLLVLIATASSTIGVFQRYWDYIGIGAKARNIFMDIVETETGVKVDSMSSVNFISSLPQKVLVIHDEQDELVPLSDALKLKALRSDIELMKTDGLGHNRILHDESVCMRVSQFLAKS
jgi:pimeloyl-ACP methyl ester carboxylesterase